MIGATTVSAEGALPQSPSPSSSALTLQDCYHLALQRSEDLKTQSENIAQAEARYQQALGNVLPHLSFNVSESLQDTSGISGGDGGVGGTFTRRERPEVKFIVRQPLFSGFREFAAMSSFKSESRRATLLFNRASKLLFQDVARAFYLVVQLETDLGNIRTLIQLTQERVKELQERVRLGKSRPSEVLTVQSQQAAQRSLEEQIKEQILTARELLSFLTGNDVGERSLRDELPNSEIVEPEAMLLAKTDQRSDVQAQREQVLSQRARVQLAKGSLLPTASLLGNYYIKRVGFQSGINWDILLSLEAPLFQGGTARAQVKEAASQLQQAELRLSRLSRDVRSEIKRASVALASGVAQAKALEEAFNKAKESYTLQVREYRLGLVNNLEVLQAMNAMQDTRRSWDRTLVQSKLAFLQLKVATEELP
ncbi:MAG: TolC family protein [Elusimicrobia bacterium]|nr:TolC family protein [Elusimicrobiota bacterium]